jgi:hypothetical protein
MRNNTAMGGRLTGYPSRQAVETSLDTARKVRAPANPVLRAVASLMVLTAAGRGQVILEGSGPGGEAHLFNTDAAILESQDPRKDLPCTATPVKATLGFDLKFHSGYEVSVP